MVAALSLEFHETLNTKQIEQCVNRLETSICRAFPDVVTLFVKPQNAEVWLSRLKRRVSIAADDPHE